eukprot:2679034-Amphidinium_carterae.1
MTAMAGSHEAVNPCKGEHVFTKSIKYSLVDREPQDVAKALAEIQECHQGLQPCSCSPAVAFVIANTSPLTPRSNDIPRVYDCLHWMLKALLPTLIHRTSCQVECSQILRMASAACCSWPRPRWPVWSLEGPDAGVIQSFAPNS